MEDEDIPDTDGCGSKTFGAFLAMVALMFILIGLGIGNYAKSVNLTACDMLDEPATTQPSPSVTVIVVPSSNPEACKATIEAASALYAVFGMLSACFGGIFLVIMFLAASRIFGGQRKSARKPDPLAEEEVTQSQYEGPGEPL